MEPDKTYSAIADLLVQAGASICFALSGTANFKITQALETRGIRCIAARHECNAVTMADAHARLTGGLTLTSVHSGPGLTHAATAIAEAAKSGTPLLVLAGDVARGDLNSNFSMDQAAFVQSLGAKYERLHTPASAVSDTVRALNRVLAGRETVVLGMPLDVQEARYEGLAPEWRGIPARGRLRPDPGAIGRVVEMLDDAERPLFIGGRGAHVSGARPAIRALAERCGGLLATTACANGLFADDEWSLGICGGFASEAALELIGQADVVVGFGAALNKWTSKNGKIFGAARVVQVDVDPSQLGRHLPIAAAIHGDALTVAQALLDGLAERNSAAAAHSWRSDATRATMMRLNSRNHPFEDHSGPDSVDPRTLSRRLDELLPADRVLVTDGGHFMGWPPRYIHVADVGSSSLALAFQSVSLGLAAAIGAGLARPGRLVVLGTGDGGFIMSIADLETAIRLGISLCIVVYNDSSYAAEVHHFGRTGFPTGIVEFPEVDFAGIARGFGARACTVRSTDDLGSAQDWIAEGAAGVFLIDAKISRTIEADWHRDAYKD